jgi:predicted permease
MPAFLRKAWLRLRALVARRRVEQELEDELAFHLEMEARKHAADGMTSSQARERARRRFGSPAAIADACRDARGVAFLETLARDAVIAIRTFRRTPTVTVTVVATIALALGVNAALFTIFNAYVFRTEPIRDPGALYRVTKATRFFTFREYAALRQDNEVFVDVAARRLDVHPRMDGRLTNGQLVTGNFFELLGVGAAQGRVLTPADVTMPGEAPVIVLSHLGWQRLFASDPNVIGRTIRLNGFACAIIGIAPEGFIGLDIFPADFWAPLTLVSKLKPLTWEPLDNPGSLELLGRLKPGMTETRARQSLGLPGAFRLTPKSTATPFSASTVVAFSPLFIAFGLVLLIACANIANLMLARAFARQREIGIRLSLGASRGRIVRQLVTESLLLALAASVFGLIISRALVDTALYFLLATMPAELAELFGLAPFPTDIRIAGFLVAAAILSAVVFGLLPAWRATRVSLVRASRGEIDRDARPGRARNALVVVQVTASALLLIAAGVMLRGALRAAAEDPGVRVDDTLIIPLNDQTPAAAVIPTLTSDPRVISFASVWPGVPIESLARDGFVETNGSGRLPTRYRFVSAEFFDVFDVDVVAGRGFTALEATSRAPVAVVSESAARQFWPDGIAIGRSLRLTRDESATRPGDLAPSSPVVTVIGVAQDITGFRMAGDERNRTPIFLPLPTLDAGKALIVRVHGDPELARRALMDRLTTTAPQLPAVFKTRTFGAIATYPLSVAFWVTIVLGAIALALTLSGLCGVLSYLVAQRTKEVGVRMALGATTGAVMQLVLWQSLRLVAIGLAAGVTFAVIVSKLLVSTGGGSQLARIVDPLDPVAYVASLLAIVAACTLAALVPARRAARINPLSTLRHE